MDDEPIPEWGDHESERRSARILIVDDEEANVALVEQLLRQDGYTELRSSTDARRTLPLYLDFQPDLLILDLLMPHQDGYAVLQQLRPRLPTRRHFPILVMTADTAREAKLRALTEGATDFLTKPFDAMEMLLRTRILLTMALLSQRVSVHNESLENTVQARTHEIERDRIDLLARLALAGEYRDDETGKHTQRVGRTASLIADAMNLPHTTVEMIKMAAPMHDIGKIGIPDHILLTKQKYRPEQFEAMKAHVAIGAKILSGGNSPLLQMAEEIALGHHERWDGTGYLGLKNTETPLPARITAVADVFDALTHARPYKEAWPIDRALEEIVQNRERQFDPQLVDVFAPIVEQRGDSLL